MLQGVIYENANTPAIFRGVIVEMILLIAVSKKHFLNFVTLLGSTRHTNVTKEDDITQQRGDRNNLS
jgi:hypothetical protein